MSNFSTIQQSANRILDATNMRCPYAIMYTKQDMCKLNKDQRLLVKCKDPSFNVDLQVYLRHSGHLLLETGVVDNIYYYLIKHTAKEDKL